MTNPTLLVQAPSVWSRSVPHRDQRGVAGGAQPPELFPALTLTLNLLIPPRQDTDAKRCEVVRATGHPQFGSEVTAGT
jgi:hypothetical protein